MLKMSEESKNHEQNVPRILLLSGLYAFFMYPISYFGWGDGISVNYSFLILPIISIAFFNYNFKIIKKIVVIQCAVYTLIYVLSCLLQKSEETGIGFRQFLSFAAFMSLFSMFFVNKKMIAIDAFKIGLIIISVLLSFISIYKYINMCEVNRICLDLKAEVGSQRYGFLYIMAIWVLAYLNSKSVFENIIRYGLVTTIVFGLALTYSRTSFIALVAITVFFLFYRISNWNSYKIKLTSAEPLVLYVFVIFMILTFTLHGVGDVNFGSGIPKNAIEEISNKNASAGYRLNLWSDVITYVSQNPLLGSGFKGVWVLNEDKSGSAHNQYFDVLFRVGIFGFLIYISILYTVIIKLKRLDYGLFVGFVGVLVFGVFHETFKLSQGAFILSFLYRIAIMDESSVDSSEGQQTRPKK